MVLWWSQCRFRLEGRKFLEYYYGRKKVEFVGIQILALSGSWSEYWYCSLCVNQKPIFVEQRCCFSLIKLTVLSSSFSILPPTPSPPLLLSLSFLLDEVSENALAAINSPWASGVPLSASSLLMSCTAARPPPHPAPNLHHPPFSPSTVPHPLRVNLSGLMHCLRALKCKSRSSGALSQTKQEKLQNILDPLSQQCYSISEAVIKRVLAELSCWLHNIRRFAGGICFNATDNEHNRQSSLISTGWDFWSGFTKANFVFGFWFFFFLTVWRLGTRLGDHALWIQNHTEEMAVIK